MNQLIWHQQHLCCASRSERCCVLSPCSTASCDQKSVNAALMSFSLHSIPYSMHLLIFCILFVSAVPNWDTARCVMLMLDVCLDTFPTWGSSLNYGENEEILDLQLNSSDSIKKDMPTPFSSAYTLLSFLTASMPDSCMPMLMTTTLSTCQRTVSSTNSFHTDSVSTDNRERCSSCISSISAWMLHLARYHFRAERQGTGSSMVTAHHTTSHLKHRSLQQHLRNFLWLKGDLLNCISSTILSFCDSFMAVLHD